MPQRTPSAKKTSPSRSTAAPTAPLVGAHMSIAGGVAKAIDRALSVGCNAMQIFVKNNMQWFAKPLPQEEADAFVNHPQRGELLSVFGHTGYMINLGAINPEFHEKSTRALSEELVRADQLDLPFLVLHPGAHMGEGEEAGLAKIAASLDTVLAALPEVRTKVALETTAGQGTTVGRTFEEIAALFERSSFPDRLCVCLDTAHVFAAGYDLTTEASTLAMWDEFDRIIGLDRLAAIHCNDSKGALGSRVDRHDHIGKGKIGLPAFKVIMSDPRFAAIPKVLETPKGKEMAEDVENMAVLRGLVGA